MESTHWVNRKILDWNSFDVLNQAFGPSLLTQPCFKANSDQRSKDLKMKEEITRRLTLDKWGCLSVSDLRLALG